MSLPPRSTTEEMLSVLLVDNDTAHTASIAAAVCATKRCKLSGQVDTPQQAVHWLRDHTVAALLLNQESIGPAQLGAICELRKIAPRSAIVVLTAQCDGANARLALGAQHDLLKEAHLEAAVVERTILYALGRKRCQAESPAVYHGGSP